MSINIYEYMAAFLRRTDSPNILEIGAHTGEDTRRFRQMFPKATIWALEPDPRNIKRNEVEEINKVCNFFPYALGATNGTANFHLSNREADNWSGSSSLKAPKEHLKHFPTISFNETVKVPIYTLDVFCDEQKIEHLDFAWLDCQGAENEILKGGQKILKKTRGVYCEVYDEEMYEGQPKLSDLMATLGDNWSIVEKYPSEVFVVNRNYV